MTSGDWLFGIRVENTMRIICVFNAFSTRIRQVQNVGSRVAIFEALIVTVNIVLLNAYLTNSPPFIKFGDHYMVVALQALSFL